MGAVAGALACVHRRTIISRLCRGPATTTELAAEAGRAMPTIHQHLDRLRSAGLVTSVKRGRTVTHTVRTEPMTELHEWIAIRRSFWSLQLESLASALEDDGGR